MFTASPQRQRGLQQAVLTHLRQPLGQMPIYTFNGWIRNVLFDNWPWVEDRLIQASSEVRPSLQPRLCGLDTTEFLLSLLLGDLQANRPDWASLLPQHRRSLFRQVLRRLRLRAENRLSRPQLEQLTLWLGLEHEAPALNWLEAQADKLTYRTRSLDAAKQLEVFWGLLEKNEAVASWQRDRARFLFVDDVDEASVAQQQVINWLLPSARQVVLAGNPSGGSKLGYLGAYPQGWEAIKDKVRQQFKSATEEVTLTAEESAPQAPLLEWLERRWLKGEESATPPDDGAFIQLEPMASTWVEGLDAVLNALAAYLAAGGKAGDLVWLVPTADRVQLGPLQYHLQQRGIPVTILSGTDRPAEHPQGRALLYALLLLNPPAEGMRLLSPLEWRLLLSQIAVALNLPLSWKELEPLAQAVGQAQGVKSSGGNSALPSPEHLSPYLSEPLNNMVLSLYEQLQRGFSQLSGQTLQAQAYWIVEQWLQPGWNHEGAPSQAVTQLLEGLEQQAHLCEALELPMKPTLYRWLRQALMGVVANTPAQPLQVSKDALVISTPQKLIDAGLSRPEQWWLNATSVEWCRQSDAAPLYHAAVFTPDFDMSRGKDEVLPQLNQRRLEEQTARRLLKVLPLAENKVRLFRSQLDVEGNNQPGPLLAFLPETASETAVKAPAGLLPPPRSDQAPALEYRAGTMAITAVPGAGKTFINVHLIKHLIEIGNPAPSLLVLTFMESAAKTLQARLQKLLGADAPQPTITTIHGLAYRLLSEGDNAERLGLPEGWRIADEPLLDQISRQAALATHALASRTEPELRLEDWMAAMRRGLGQAKSLMLSYDEVRDYLQAQRQSSPLAEALVQAWDVMVSYLRAENLLDFTDLIRGAIQLLEEQPLLRAKYQAQFNVILEDEAQDSSPLLQRLLFLLSREPANFIRTGDLNQCITTTFSAAHPEGFRHFIDQADKTVTMNYSGRCTPSIIELANQWIARAPKAEVSLNRAFHPIEMHPVEGFNPAPLGANEVHKFETPTEEDAWLIADIQATYKRYPQATCAVLVRTNREVLRLTTALQSAGLQAIAHQEGLHQSPVFEVVLAYLEALAYPMEAVARVKLFDSLVKAHCRGFAELSPDTIEDAKAILSASPVFFEPVTQVAHSECLLQLYYDWLDFSRDALGTQVDTLIIRLTERLFNSVLDRSNGYLCAIYAQQSLTHFNDAAQNAFGVQAQSPLELVLDAFRQAKRSRRGLRGFTAQDVAAPETSKGFVHVLTLHKAKGQEYDAVWLPSMTDRDFPYQPRHVRPRLDDRLLLWINRAAQAIKPETSASLPTTMDELVLSQLEEEARLVYVGLTRARQQLRVSTHEQKARKNGKLYPVEPTLAFQIMKSCVTSQASTSSPNSKKLIL